MRDDTEMPTYATLGKRAIAAVADAVIFLVAWGTLAGTLFAVVAGVSLIATGHGSGLQNAICGSWWLGYLGYYVAFEAWLSTTPGKALCGLRVRKADGSRLDLRAATLRNLLRVVDGLGFYLVGAGIAGTGPRRQRLGDLVAGTVVVESAAPTLVPAGPAAERDWSAAWAHATRPQPVPPYEPTDAEETTVPPARQRTPPERPTPEVAPDETPAPTAADTAPAALPGTTALPAPDAAPMETTGAIAPAEPVASGALDRRAPPPVAPQSLEAAPSDATESGTPPFSRLESLALTPERAPPAPPPDLPLPTVGQSAATEHWSVRLLDWGPYTRFAAEPPLAAPRGTHWIVDFTAHNLQPWSATITTSDCALESAGQRLTPSSQTSYVEKGISLIQTVPAGATAEHRVVFDVDPAARDLVLDVLGVRFRLPG